MRTALLFFAACFAACLAPSREPMVDAGPNTVCGYGTCRGCCTQGICVSGYDNEACGLLGRACEACSMEEVCGSTRTCVKAPPDAGPGWDKTYPDAPSGPPKDPTAEPPERCQTYCQ